MTRQKNLFRFQQFDVRQENTPMKVGTDGVLLGAWAGHNKVENILDIGTGTGLIALMLAQRFPTAMITGLELHEAAALEATENARSSKFFERIEILTADFLQWRTDEKYDLIVSNPPYFKNSLLSNTTDKNLARHQHTLSIEKLIEKSNSLLSDKGTLAIILPPSEMAYARKQAGQFGLNEGKTCEVYSKEGQQMVRVMQEWSNVPVENTNERLIIYNPDNSRSAAYAALTKTFYL